MRTEGTIETSALWQDTADTIRMMWIDSLVWCAFAIGLLVFNRRFWTQPPAQVDGPDRAGTQVGPVMETHRSRIRRFAPIAWTSARRPSCPSRRSAGMRVRSRSSPGLFAVVHVGSSFMDRSDLVAMMIDPSFRFQRRLRHHVSVVVDRLGRLVLAASKRGGTFRSGCLLYRGHRHRRPGWRHGSRVSPCRRSRRSHPEVLGLASQRQPAEGAWLVSVILFSLG